jgi:hypothetical protein
MLDVPSTTRAPTVSLADAHRAASAYVLAHIDPTFEIVDGAQYYSKPLGREIWRFFLCGEHGPVGLIQIDAQTNAVIPLTNEEIRTVREKAAIRAARMQGVLPINEHGYVFATHARRQANSYLNEYLSMFYSGADPIFIPGEPAVWQVTIIFKMYNIGPFTLGVLDVDARTGEPTPLPKQQLKRIRERTRAIIRHQPSTTATG